MTISKIGIMGGTFDPIHFGHLYIAEASRVQFHLDKVLFIPAGNPVHKVRTDIVASEHRAEMTKLAIQNNPFFELSTIEIYRNGPTYAVDTLRELNAENASAEYFYITGSDTILDIMSWKDVSQVLEYCRFIGVTRPGFSSEKMKDVTSGLTTDQREKVLYFETPGMGLSSTEIRTLVSSGQSIKYLVPEEVENYIVQNHLYI